MKNNITYWSIYQSCLEDDKVEVVSVNDGLELESGKIDISDILQKSLYHVKQKYGYGIVMLQEGDYYINKTIYIPRGIRLFGFGSKRPKITLLKNAEGFGSDNGHTINNAKYMCWFTANMPEKEEEAEDANPGTFYRLKRVYKWDQKSAKIELLLSTHYRPLSLACDTLGNLLMVIEYKPVKYAKKDGVLELDIEEYGERSRGDFGACFYAFFRSDRRIRVLSLNTEKGESSFYELEHKLRSEASLKRLYYPVNQWRDNGDMKTVIQLPDDTCYIAPDGITAITNNPALARATGLCAVQRNEVFYAVDEYNKYVLKLKVDENLNLQDPEIVAYRGEYSAIASDKGELYVSDNLLYCYMGEQVRTIALAKRPACMVWKDKEYKYLCISARTSLYVMKVKE